MEIRKTVNITEQTYVEFCKTSSSRRNIRTLIFTTILITALLTFMNNESNYLLSFLWGLAYSAIYFVVAFALVFFTTAPLAKSNYRKKKLSELELDLQFNQQGITQYIGSEQGTFEWSRFRNCEETNGAFYFILSNNQVLLFSKERLAADEVKMLHDLFLDVFGPKNFIFAKVKDESVDTTATNDKEEK